MSFLDFIFPKMCIFCSKVGEYICSSCMKKLPHTLPSCPICNRLNKDFFSHDSCITTKIQCYTGWYITKEIEYILLQKVSSSILSPYIFLTDLLINYLNIHNIVNYSKILPVYSIGKKEVELNIKLANHLENQNLTDKNILFVGYQLRNVQKNIKRLPERESLNIRFLTLFRPTTIH